MPQTTMRSLKLIGENSTPTNTSPGSGAAGSGTSRSSIPSTASPYFTNLDCFHRDLLPQRFERAPANDYVSRDTRRDPCAEPEARRAFLGLRLAVGEPHGLSRCDPGSQCPLSATNE